MRPNEFMAFGHLGLAERRYMTTRLPSRKVDVLVLVSGWERRGLYVLDKIDVVAKHILFFDFDMSGVNIVGTDGAQPISLVDIDEVNKYAKRLRIPHVTHIKLKQSTSYRENAEDIDRTFGQMSPLDARFIYLESTLIPRIYLHYMIGCLLRHSRAPLIEVGYHEGSYDGIADGASLAHGKYEFVNVPIFPGSGGLSEDKYFVVGLGGDDSLFYDLYEQRSLNQVRLLAGLDSRYPNIIRILEDQIDAAIRTFRISEGDVFRTGAFSVNEYVTALNKVSLEATKHDSINVFVSGPRPQAIAAALFACVDQRVSIIGRVPQRYTVRDNMPGEFYWSYRVADLVNPELVNVDPFCGDGV